MGSDDTTIPVRSEHVLDIDALTAYLAAHLDGFRPPIELRQFAGGQSNPTYQLQADDGRRWVLRKKPPGELLPSAHLVEREYRVLAALQGSGVPVPPVHLLCEDPDVVGTPFYVMDHLPGRVLVDPSLSSLSRPERAAVYESMVQTLARLHTLDPAAVGLSDYGKPSGYVERQIRVWTRQYEATATAPSPSMDHLVRWLPENVPSGDEVAIAHGDFRLGNLLLHPERPEVVAVLDWELSTLGHPLGDLAYNCLPYTLGPEIAMLPGLTDLALDQHGLPTERQYVDRYCEMTGRGAIEHWDFYVAFALFRLAAITQGVYARGLQGNASDARAMEFGRVSRQMAEAGARRARG